MKAAFFLLKVINQKSSSHTRMLVCVVHIPCLISHWGNCLNTDFGRQASSGPSSIAHVADAINRLDQTQCHISHTAGVVSTHDNTKFKGQHCVITPLHQFLCPSSIILIYNNNLKKNKIKSASVSMKRKHI